MGSVPLPVLATVALCLVLCLGEAIPAGKQDDGGTRRANAIQRLQLPRRPARLTGTRTNNGTRASVLRDTEEFSYTLWLRYTHPRLDVITAFQHEEEEVVQDSLSQPMDHLDPTNTQIWKQVFYRNKASYEEGGPVFVMISGTEDHISSRDWLKDGQMADLARNLKADRYFLPLRFFGLTKTPTTDTSRENLKFLSTEQNLQDVISFLEHLMDKGDLSEGQKVILFGAGYGGAVATWARQRFPTVVSGVVASGPTLEAKYDTFSYFPIVTSAVEWYHRKDMNCEPAMRQAFNALESSLDTPEGRSAFNMHFEPCNPFAEEQDVSAEDRAQVLGLVASLFADAVQEDVDGPNEYGRPGGDRLQALCVLLTESQESPLTMLGLISTNLVMGRCLENTYQGLVTAVSRADWASDANKLGLRQWLWLQCTELSQLPTSTSTQYTFPYSVRINMKFYRKLCDDVFGAGVSDSLTDNIASFKANYGGKNPQISNAIFVRGDLDPWKDLGPEQTLTGDNVHVFSVKRASHAHDMFPRDDFDPPWMKKTRKDVQSVLASWLKE